MEELSKEFYKDNKCLTKLSIMIQLIGLSLTCIIYSCICFFIKENIIFSILLLLICFLIYLEPMHLTKDIMYFLTKHLKSLKDKKYILDGDNNFVYCKNGFYIISYWNVKNNNEGYFINFYKTKNIKINKNLYDELLMIYEKSKSKSNEDYPILILTQKEYKNLLKYKELEQITRIIH